LCIDFAIPNGASFMIDIAQRIHALHDSLPLLDWCGSGARLKRLSRDFHWFSPVLERQLRDKQAHAAVRPRNEEELRSVVAGCVSAHVPITLRGGGTGNYGQAVPLQGGVVIDMTAFDRFLWAGNGVARAQAGIKLGKLEEHVKPGGWELRCMPSTFRTATLGGLFGGGFGGIGSISYGPLAAQGTVLAAKVMSVESEPRMVELEGKAALALHHAYGTNGIVLELELALAPAVAWDEYLLGFADGADAYACAEEIAGAPGIVKRNVALFAPGVAAYLTPLSSCLKPHETVLIVSLAPQAARPLRQMLDRFRGRIALAHDSKATRTASHSLLEYCWNHTMLYALKQPDPVTYLETLYTHGKERAQIQAIERETGSNENAGEVMRHLEFIRDAQGRTTCVGIPIIRFTTEQRLAELTALHRQHGVTINDPHTYMLDDGKHTGRLAPEILQAKLAYDPHGLLNPGKIRRPLQEHGSGESVSVDL
jgi:FAD/FMN-containing dehydrogenase